MIYTHIIHHYAASISRQGFHEIVERQRGRFEMMYKMEGLLEAACPEAFHALLLTAKNVLQSTNVRILHQSLLLSRPGVEDQTWHQDGPHVSLTSHLPCHCLNM